MKKMARVMNVKNLHFFASGLFYSKLNYCLPVFGNVFGMDKYNDQNSRYQSYTTKDNYKLQVLQNNLNRVLLNAKYDTPTEVLLKCYRHRGVLNIYLGRLKKILSVYKNLAGPTLDQFRI